VVVREARRALSAYADMEEMIRIGAYRRGSDPLVDRAIELNPQLEAFLSQDKNEVTPLAESFMQLESLLGVGAP
jgi:flagellum-specific ATP synthase